jgi:hypothetical protein
VIAPTGPYIVDRALNDYFTWLEGEGRGKKNIADARSKAATPIRPTWPRPRRPSHQQANQRLAARTRQGAATLAQQSRHEAAVSCLKPTTETRQKPTYKKAKAVQTNGATSLVANRYSLAAFSQQHFAKAISKILLNEFNAIAYDQVPNPMASEVESARPPAG